MHRTLVSLAASSTVFVSLLAPADAAPRIVHVRGTVVAVTASTVDVKTTTGVVHLATTGAKFVVVAPSSRSAIGPNTFVGIATDGEAPGAKAREVVVFPNAMRGTGEGHYAWDLPQGGDAMTNGTVAPAGSAMTNGNAGARKTTNGQLMLNVAYKGGSRRIDVPANVPIVVAKPGMRSDLATGSHVVAFATEKSGKPDVVKSVIIGQGSTVPPM